MIQVSQIVVHPDGMLLSMGLVFTERASRRDALPQHPTNPVGKSKIDFIECRAFRRSQLPSVKQNNINFLHPVGMCET